MVIDQARWDAQNLTALSESWLGDNLLGGSQLPINLAVASNFAYLDARWNCAIRRGDVQVKFADKDDPCTTEPAIRHWTGRFKPWLPKSHLRFFWMAHAHRVRHCFHLLNPPPDAFRAEE